MRSPKHIAITNENLHRLQQKIFTHKITVHCNFKNLLKIYLVFADM